MDPQLAALGTWIAGGTVSALSLATVIAIYVVRGAIARAVQQAANLEIARVNGDIAKDVERYKSGLTLDAEKRRQLVTRRLEAIDAIYAAGLEAIYALYPPGRSAPAPARHPAEVLNAFFGMVRAKSHILTYELERDVSHIIGDYHAASSSIQGDRGTVDDAKVVGDLHERLSARLREELRKPWSEPVSS
jgi:hypothetical protein